jgi:hypothetical protein
MKLPQTGGCQCGKIRYGITEEPQSVYTCHCLDCQRLTGSAFSLGIDIPEKGFRLTGIEPRRLQRTADSGRVNTRLRLPGVRFLDLRDAERWRSPRPGRHAGRYRMAAAHAPLLDSQTTTLGPASRR